MIGHFDGDLLVYRAGFAAEKMRYYPSMYLGEMYFTSKREMDKHMADHGHEAGEYEYESVRHAEPVENALHNVRSLVEKTLDSLQMHKDDMRMYLSGPTNFRDGIATLKPYKGNRDEAHKPVHGPAIKEYMEKRYNAVYSVDEEADDIVAYSHYAMFKDDPHSSVIISVDKDLDMVPGLHYNFVKEKAYYISEEEGERLFQLQLLTGDSTDNIPGVPGIGPAKAKKAIDATDNPWTAIATLYVQGYAENWKEALTENGRLLWMRRHPNEWWAPSEHCIPDVEQFNNE